MTENSRQRSRVADSGRSWRRRLVLCRSSSTESNLSELSADDGSCICIAFQRRLSTTGNGNGILATNRLPNHSSSYGYPSERVELNEQGNPVSSNVPGNPLIMSDLNFAEMRPMGGVNLISSAYPIHTQVEYTHYLVPDLDKISNAPHYWGVMDRFQAEKLLDGKPEGTFLLRDSAQSQYLFSVSFRRYGRTLHARIEQMDHRFSFDCYDPHVFSAHTVTELLEHYKDSSVCLFFEPLLSQPLNRTTVLPLQHLARSVISSNITYDGIKSLNIPNKIKNYIREYHYKQPVRVRNFEN